MQEFETKSRDFLLVRDKVRGFSLQFSKKSTIDDAGNLRIRFSPRHDLFVSFKEMNYRNCELYHFRKENKLSVVQVRIWANVLYEVKSSPKMFEWLEQERINNWYGRWGAEAEGSVFDSPALYRIVYAHTLAGEHLDADEFLGVCAEVGWAADSEEYELNAMFGGETVEDLMQEQVKFRADESQL